MAVRKDETPRHIGRAAKKVGDAAKQGKIVKFARKPLRSGQRHKGRAKKPRKVTVYSEDTDVQHKGDVMINQDAFRFRTLAPAKILYLRTTAERVGGCLDGTVSASRYPRKFRFKAQLKYDYLVLVAGPRWDRSSDEERTRIVYHALRHFRMGNSDWVTDAHDLDGFVSEVEFFGLRDSRWAKVAEQLQLFEGKKP
jgi:hypothetical protein